MRAALWLIALFAMAVAGAWLADHNNGSVSFFVDTYRIDVSLNLFMLGILAFLWMLWLTQRSLALLWALPRQARRWRVLQKERAAHAALLTACAQFMSGRYVRAFKSANSALGHEASLGTQAQHALPHAVLLRTLAHVAAAESAHALQDKAQRHLHWRQAQQAACLATGSERQCLQEAALLRAARWQLDDRDAQGSLNFLSQLPEAASRRMAALRLVLKAARLAGQSERALDAAVLLTKHRAFSPTAGHSLLRSLALDVLARTHDETSLHHTWRKLPQTLQQHPEIAAQAATRWLQMGGPPPQARAWLQAAWAGALATHAPMGHKYALIQALDAALHDVSAPDAKQWLAQLEAQQKATPHDAHLQYLTGMVCLRYQLWGKAKHLLGLATRGQLPDSRLLRSAWMALAQMAQAQGDTDQAALAWRQAACAAADAARPMP